MCQLSATPGKIVAMTHLDKAKAALDITPDTDNHCNGSPFVSYALQRGKLEALIAIGEYLKQLIDLKTQSKEDKERGY